MQWNPGAPYALDVAEFETASVSDDTLADAVSLYSGDLMGSHYDEWIAAERERLRALYEQNLFRLTVLARNERDFPRALGYAGQLVQHEPLREDARRQLMQLRYETGDRAGALREYEEFRALLAQELDVEPMPETLALANAIGQNQAAVQEQGTRAGEKPYSRFGARRPAPDLPFVGREAELEQARTVWSRAARGRGSVLCISGEAGIGKTRLAQELAELAEREGARLLVGGCSSGEPIAYEAFVKALRPALPLLSAMDREANSLAVLAELLPELDVRASDLAPPLHSAEQEQERLFQALVRVLVELSKPRPVLLVLEDLHWAGTTTLEMLEYVARRISQQAVLVVITYREEEIYRAHPLRQLRRRLQREHFLPHFCPDA